MKFASLLRRSLTIAGILVILFGIVDKVLFTFILWIGLIDDIIINAVIDYSLGFFTFSFGVGGIIAAFFPKAFEWGLGLFTVGNAILCGYYFFRGIYLLQYENAFVKISGILLLVMGFLTLPFIILSIVIFKKRTDFKECTQMETSKIHQENWGPGPTTSQSREGEHIVL